MIEQYLQAGDEPPTTPPERFPEPETPPGPTDKDYENGHFTRYFLRRTGTSRIYELSRNGWRAYDGSSKFIRFSLKWKISGPRNDVFNDAGYPVETGVEDTNLRIIEQTDQRGIASKLNDPLQYWDGRN